MKTPKIIAAAVALFMGLSSVAIAQTGPYGGRGDGPRAEQRDGHRDGHRRGERAHDRRDDRREDRQADRREDRREDRRADRRVDRRDDRRDWRRDAWRDARHGDRVAERWDRRDPRWDRHWHRGAGPQHRLYRGGHLPPHYRSHIYVVNDWRGHRLHRPPPGYHWVQTGGDYVLAAIATGVILSILLSH